MEVPLNHGYYHVRTRAGRLIFVEHYGRLVHDSIKGPLFYIFLTDQHEKYLSVDLGTHARLPGIKRFLEYTERELQILNKVHSVSDKSFICLGLVNFSVISSRYDEKTVENFQDQVARIICNYFPNDFVAALSEGRFMIYTGIEDIESTLRNLRNEIKDLKKEMPIDIRAGIYMVRDPDVMVDVAAKLAETAYVSVKNSADRFYSVYSLESHKDLE